MDDENALERFFDTYIAKDSWEKEEEQEHKEEREMEEDIVDKLARELPDELLLYYKPSHDGTDSCSQNPTGKAELKDQPSEAHETEPVHVNILNIVSLVNVGCKLDLYTIASKTRNIEYNSKRSWRLTLRLKKPRITAIIYQNGKIFFAGAKSVKQTRVGARRVIRKVQKLGFPVVFINSKILNVVATCQLFPIDLERLQQEQNKHCSHEMELSPSFHYKGIPGVDVTICRNGVITLMGAKSPEQANKVCQTMYRTLSPYRML